MKINRLFYNYNTICCLVFLIIGLILIIAIKNYPIGDFGNYYYGSKIYLEGNFTIENYKSIAHFNNQINAFCEINFFENYIPVPPFSLLFYLPFTIFKSIVSKLIFNVLSLVFFCFSLNKILKLLQVKGWLILLLPLVFLFTLYNNIIQGQTYLLIISLLMEAFIASEKNKTLLASFLVAICICLKIFPVIILIYFLFKKKYKIFVFTVVISLLFYIITAYKTNLEMVKYYFTDILPRLLNNDIVGAYYYGNQSIYSMLLNLFSFDGLVNIHPIVNNPTLLICLESICVSLIIYSLLQLRKIDSFVLFGMCLFINILIGRYNTTYGMIVLAPFIVSIVKLSNTKKGTAAILACFLIALNIPIVSLSNYPILIQYIKLLLLLVGYIIFVNQHKVKFNYRMPVVLFGAIFLLKYTSFLIIPAKYYNIQNTKGILYDYKISNDTLVLYSTNGDKSHRELFRNKDYIKEDTNIMLKNNLIYYKSKLLCGTKDNKMNAKLFNDSSIIFMSDLNQGVRFYKLRIIPIK